MALVRSLSARGDAGATKADVLAAAGTLIEDALPPARHFFGPVGNGEDPAPPSVEFHDQLGPLCAHPFLMRKLGLVFDLEITLPPGTPPVTNIAVRTNWPTRVGLTPHDEVPMRVAVDGAFKARVDQEDFRVSDWLALGGSKYAVGQLDLINAVHQVDQMVDDLAAAPGDDAPIEVPALLESGLSVICGDLGPVMRGRLARQRDVEDGIDAWLGGGTPTPLLFAEDITLGYRCDVDDDETAEFLSLHDRRVPTGYRFPRDKTLEVVPPADEGWGSIALTTDGSQIRRPRSTGVTYHQEGEPDVDKVEARDETEWRLNDHVFTWGGWSLSTPRVGNSTTGRGAVKARERNVPDPHSATQVVVDYAHVDGTLPKLRYGRTYTLRARCVDLAGNGPALADAPPPDAEAPPTQFGRLAPLVAPLPVRRASRPDPGVGDLPDVLVIRSELEDTDRDVVPTDRLLFPPRISQSRLERHDLPLGGNDPGSYELIARRDALSLADQTLVDPETGELVAGAAIVDDEVTPGPTRPPVLYLPDPVAGQAAFVGLPGAGTALPVLVPYGTWPDVEAVQLELRSGEGAPRVSRSERRVTVRLPKGTVATAALATAPDAALLDHMALAQGLDPAARTEARRGLNPMLSPRRLVTLVHATRLPLDAPLFGTMTATREDVGQTDVLIGGRLGVHRETTEHVVIRSRWVDTIDDPDDPDHPEAPFERITKRVVEDVPLALESEDGPTEELAATSLELGDTKRRSVRLIAEGFSRFSRYFTERIDFIKGAPGNSLNLNAEGVVAQSVTLARKDGTERFTRGVEFEVTRDGELTILDDAAIPQGTVCRVEFIPRPVSRLSLESDTGPDFVADVPASSAPDLPSVVAVVPAFARHVSTTDTSITVDHDGRVLRLHLARPWFGSGAGELLGVAVDPAGTPEPVLTRWGRDPLTAGAGPALAVATGHFPGASEVAPGVDDRFDVAGHEVAYDGDRRLWTADVSIDAEIGYRPFVRLHVCRFQPVAVPGQHLSPTVELEPLRLGALRRVEVTQVAKGQANVRLSGPDDDNVVTVVLQEADRAVADPDLRWQDVATTVLTRSGTTAAAMHEDDVDITGTGTGAERRLVVEDAEPVTVEIGGALADATVVAYREVIEIPAGW
jgi:hypothetical protein